MLQHETQKGTESEEFHSLQFHGITWNWQQEARTIPTLHPHISQCVERQGEKAVFVCQGSREVKFLGGMPGFTEGKKVKIWLCEDGEATECLR